MKKNFIIIIIILVVLLNIREQNFNFDENVLNTLAQSTITNIGLTDSYFGVVFDLFFNFIFKVNIKDVTSFLDLIGG